jgi:hypothetical protein
MAERMTDTGAAARIGRTRHGPGSPADGTPGVSFGAAAAVMPSRAETDAIDALLDDDAEGGRTPLDALLTGVADGSLFPSGLLAALLAPPDARRRRIDSLLEAHRAVDPGPVRDLSSRLLRAADSTQVRTLADRFRFVEPRFLDGDRIDTASDPVRFTLTDVRERGIAQGRADDCWLLAGIGATAAVDVESVRANITVHANGTYTVTVYRNRKPVRVTVTGWVPRNEHGRAVYAGRRSGGGRAPSWLSVYEKAAAQVLGDGSYAGLTAGRPSTGISAVTGRPTDFLSTSPLPFTGSGTLARVRQALDDRQPVSALTTWRITDDSISSWHVYYVTGIRGDRIVVQNPWGRGGSGTDANVAGTLLLTEDAFDRTFAWASAGRSRPGRRGLRRRRARS